MHLMKYTFLPENQLYRTIKINMGVKCRARVYGTVRT